MKDWCLASTGAEAPWVALGFAIVLIIAGAVMLRQARLRRALAVTAATLAALVAIAGLSIAPAPAFAASADGRGTACPTAAEQAVVTSVAAPTVVEPPVAPTLVGATLGDYVWIDANRNGIQDPTEEPAVGAQITLLDAATGLPVTTGFDGRAIASTQTSDDAGRYSFTALAAGSYLLRLETASSVVGEIVTLLAPFAGRVTVLNRTQRVFDDDAVSLVACGGGDVFEIQLPGLGHVFDTTPLPAGLPYSFLTVAPVKGSPTTLVNAGIGIPGDDDYDSDIDPVTRQTSTPVILSDGQVVTGVDIGLDPGISSETTFPC